MTTAHATATAPATVSNDEDRKVVLANRMLTAQTDATNANKIQKVAKTAKDEIAADLFGTYKKEGIKDPVVTTGLMAEGDEITLGEVTYVAVARPTTGVSYQGALEHIITRQWKDNPPKWVKDALATFVTEGKSYSLKEKK